MIRKDEVESYRWKNTGIKNRYESRVDASSLFQMILRDLIAESSN